MAYVKNFPQDEVVGLAGQVKVRAGEERVVHAGEALVMPAKVPHSLHADQSFKMLLTVVFPRYGSRIVFYIYMLNFDK